MAKCHLFQGSKDILTFKYQFIDWKPKKEKLYDISVDAKRFDKVQHSFLIKKNYQEIRNIEKLPQFYKRHLWKTYSKNYTKIQCSLSNQEKHKEICSHNAYSAFMGGSNQLIRQEKQIRKIQIRRVGVKLTFADMTVHNSMASVKSEFSKVVE